MNTMTMKRRILAGATLALALALSGCESVQPRFDRALNSMKSLFEGDGTQRDVAATPTPEAEAKYAEAQQLRAKGDERWLARLEAAAALGHPAAAYETGMVYTQGKVVPKDLDAGARWINRAADLGEPRAQYLVGANFMAGNGVAKDPERGVAFLARAGEQGHIRAQYLLGMAYADGNGVGRNPAWAARWYGRAARAGHVDAQYAYGVMYASGKGLPRDDREAYRWLTLASAGGHDKAGDVAMKVAGRLSNEDISQVEADAKRFVPKNYSTLTDPPTVMFVQYALRNIGYDAGPVDGLPGQKTRDGIRAYEAASNLPVEGRITVSVLDGLIESTSQ